jgi:hypothetical protein
MIRVRALRKGWYGTLRRRPGAEFDIHSIDELGSWMERVNKPGRKKTTQSAEGGEKSPLSHGSDNLSRTETGD